MGGLVWWQSDYSVSSISIFQSFEAKSHEDDIIHMKSFKYLGLVQVLAQELDLGCCMRLSELNMYRVHIYWQRLHKDQCMSLCSPVQHRQVHILI